MSAEKGTLNQKGKRVIAGGVQTAENGLAILIVLETENCGCVCIVKI